MANFLYYGFIWQFIKQYDVIECINLNIIFIKEHKKCYISSA